MHDGSGLFEGLPNPMKVARYHSLVVHSGEGEGNALFTVTARAPEGEVMALQYRDRPWVGVQFHPEFKSRPMAAHPLFREFIKAAKNNHKK